MDDDDGTVFDGRIEAVIDGVAVGWAWRRDENVPVEVAIVLDGVVVAVKTADARRGNLREAGIGNGRHGFAIDLPRDLPAGRHRIAATIVPVGPALPPASGFPGVSRDPRWQSRTFFLDGDEVDLPGDQVVPPLTELVDELASPHPAAAAIPELVADGVVESVARGVVTGWIGAAHQEVVLQLNDVEQGRISADIERPDLPTGARGFRFRLPEALAAALAGELRLSIRADNAPLAVAPGVLTQTDLEKSWNAPMLRLAQLDADSSETERAVIGTGGWLFPERDGASARWNDPLAEPALARAVSRIAGWSAAFAALDIAHVIAVMPTRERLESTCLPSDVEGPGDGPLLQLRRAGDDGAGFELLDLLRALEEARRDGTVSMRTGPELSAHGARRVARTLVREAAKHVRGHRAPVPPRLPLVTFGSFRGSFAGRRKLVVAGSTRVELPVALTPLDTFGESTALPDTEALTAQRAPTPAHIASRPVPYQVFESSANDRLRLAVLGLEARDPIVTCLVETFQRTVVTAASEPDFESLELEAPQVVLHVLREDQLFRLSDA